MDAKKPLKGSKHALKQLIILFTTLFLAFLLRINSETSLYSTETISLVLLIYINLQFGLWFGKKFFTFTQEKLKERFTKTIILQLFTFYVIVFLVAMFFLFSFLYALNLIHGQSDISIVFGTFLDNEIKPLLTYYTIGILIGSLFFFYILWQESLKREQKLKEEKLIFQYETLKNQVNPHFLFNSLNTLSSLVSNQPELSEEFITKLSSIYRYILENKDIELIELTKEIDFVKDYFYLQQIRDESKISLRINLNSNNFKILPISLQILIENAVKHNIATREKPLNILISQTIDDFIVIENNLQPKNQIIESSGLGLKNLAERVKIITKKEVLIKETRDKFVVSVPVVKNN